MKNLKSSLTLSEFIFLSKIELKYLIYISIIISFLSTVILYELLQNFFSVFFLISAFLITIITSTIISARNYLYKFHMISLFSLIIILNLIPFIYFILNEININSVLLIIFLLLTINLLAIKKCVTNYKYQIFYFLAHIFILNLLAI